MLLKSYNNSNIDKIYIYTVSTYKMCHWFFRCNFYKIYWRIFIIFLCTTSPKNAEVIGVRIFCHTFVVLLPYHVKVSDTKVHISHNISTLHMLISITFTETSIDETNKHIRKSEAQNLYGKCPPFTWTYAFKRLRHRAITATMMVWSGSLHSLITQQTFLQLLHIMDPRTTDPLLKYIPDAVVHWTQIWRIG